MKAEEQVPRNALVWMIIALFALVAPHVGRIPPWVLAIYLLAAVWRIMVYRGRWSFPGRLVKALLIVVGTSGIYLSFGSLVGLEPTVALLLVAFAFKLIELSSRKDAYVLLFLAYFICLLEFLFTQHMLAVLYSAVAVLLVTTALVALHQPGQHSFNRRSIRHAGIMLLQALPLMVVLFLLFPRFGPLWNVPLQSHAAKTGVSDFMRPGDVSSLSQSDAVAFRAEFIGRRPDVANLYWRGLVFSKLDSGAWRSLQLNEVPISQLRPQARGQRSGGHDYSIILEPTQQNWLYSLDFAVSPTEDVVVTPNFTLASKKPIIDEFQYRVSSSPNMVLDPQLSEWRRRVETGLPRRAEPRTQALARQMREQAGNDRQYALDVMRMFNEQPYIYTLQPPLLQGADRVDQFLFDTRQGFCEHFAAAFVVMMRAAGVPARVVAGYQGGEINPVNNTVIVHQFDAHAWAEIWLPGEGWVQMDPTRQVAPDRIYYGLEAALRGEGSFLANSPLSPLRFREVQWINRLRLEYDALTYRWQKWVIGFDSDRQFELLGRLLGDLNPAKFALVLLGTFALVLLPVAASLMLRRRIHRLSPLDRHYLAFCERVAQLGPRRGAGETPGDFAERAGRELPEWAPQLRAITGMYERLAYAGGGYDRQRRAAMLADFRRTVRRFGRRRPPDIL